LDIYGIKEFQKKLNDGGYVLSLRNVYYHLRVGNIPYWKIIDGKTYVFTDKEIKAAVEFGEKIAYQNRHRGQKK